MRFSGAMVDTTPQAVADYKPEIHNSFTNAERMIGVSTALERPFNRLQEKPEANVVRPEPVLKQSLTYIFEKAEKFENKAESYVYLNEQLKSIRQDLVIQQIENEFALECLVTHARLCLEIPSEPGDLGEFNKNQSLIRHLHTKLPESDSKIEFLSYRIIYYAILRNRGWIAAELRAATTDAMLKNPVISHAIDVAIAAEQDDFSSLAVLYGKCPSESTQRLMLHFYTKRNRCRWLQMKCRGVNKGTNSKIQISELRSELGFDLSDRENANGALLEFLQHIKADVSVHFDVLDCTKTIQAIKEFFEFVGTRRDAQHAKESLRAQGL